MKKRKFKIYSFDVFDTVLTRRVGSPQSLFLLLGQILSNSQSIHLSAEAFYHARVSAETLAYKNSAPMGQPTLADIYRELQYALNLSDSTVCQIMKKEQLFEKEFVRSVPEVVTRIEAARREGGKIVYISDMYLPASLIKELLRMCGVYHNEDTLYVSCEHQMSKRHGELFKKVLESENVLPGDMLHCGNDPLADHEVPQKLGIAVTPFIEANLNRYEVLMEAFTFKTMGFSSLLAGASRLSRLCESLLQRNSGSVRDVAAGVAAPLLVSYVLWFLNQAEEKKLKRLYFVSRDGQILLEIAKDLQKRCGTNIELHYLYGSRQAWHLARLKELNDSEWSWILDSWGKVTLRLILKRVDICPESIVGLLDKHGLSQADLDRLIDPNQGVMMGNRKLFEDPDMQCLILQRAAEKRLLLYEYFRQEGVFDEIAYGVVDLGWKGQLQCSFNAIVADHRQSLPTWFFWGSVQNLGGQEGATSQSFMFNAPRNIGDVQCQYSAVFHLEVFCAGDHNMVEGYLKTSEGIKPIFNSQNEIGIKFLDGQGFRDVVRVFLENLPVQRIPKFFAGLRELNVQLLELFHNSPSDKEVQVWGPIPIYFEQTGTHSVEMARPLRVDDALDILFFGRVLKSGFSIWPQACYQMTPPFTVSLIRLAGRIHRRVNPLWIKIMLFYRFTISWIKPQS